LSGIVAVAIAACSGGAVTQNTTPDTGGTKKKDGGTATGGTGGSWVPPPIDGSPQGGAGGSGTCGNSVLDDGESCDDGNTVPGDGCTPICQRQADCKCETPGKPCTCEVRCGDGVLATVEACDDGNSEPDDGCSADCKAVDKGWQCRVPGHRCVPLCGDGIKTAGEGCDDGETKNDDGCSSTCQIEPGWDCQGTPSKCTKSVCGNGKVEAGEACDNGEKNGLMFGDGTGCSKTCTKEPTCRDKDGHNIACTPTCGDGNLDPGEECDDGNQNDRDGCSSKCKPEQGFLCSPQNVADTQNCKADPNKKCLVLPIVYRDFKNEKEKGGHPDFYNMGTRDSSGNATTWCVPDSGGPAKKNDSTARCWDIADPVLVKGKPVYNKTRADNMCACQFTDWSKDGNGGNVPNYTDAESPLHDSGGWHTGVTWTDGKPRWTGRVRIVKDADSFGQWFTDNDFNKKAERTLELADFGEGRFQFSSPAHTVDGGFFPIDDLTSDEAPLCNLWPYWYWNQAGKTCSGNQYLFPPSVDKEGWVASQGKKHNSWFTSEVHYLFAYNEKGMSLQFYGDDDLFIYINGQLVLDLGGVHRRLPGKVTVSGNPGKATIIEGGSVESNGAISACTSAMGPDDCRNRDLDLKLVPGSIYEIAIFHADRHPTESNYQLTLSGFTTTRSVCQPRCGDGIVSAGEECDDGDKNNDTLYGGCTTKCKLGPFCGDGNKDEGEACDLGRDNGVQADGTVKCTEACKLPQRCGDGVVDSNEECDMGQDNGQPGKRCTSACRLEIL
jgi:cysteine-rich repeat protein